MSVEGFVNAKGYPAGYPEAPGELLVLTRASPAERRAALERIVREAADRCFSPSNAEAVLQLPRFA